MDAGVFDGGEGNLKIGKNVKCLKGSAFFFTFFPEKNQARKEICFKNVGWCLHPHTTPIDVLFGGGRGGIRPPPWRYRLTLIRAKKGGPLGQKAFDALNLVIWASFAVTAP